MTSWREFFVQSTDGATAKPELYYIYSSRDDFRPSFPAITYLQYLSQTTTAQRFHQEHFQTNAIDKITITSNSFAGTDSKGSRAQNMPHSNGYEWVPWVDDGQRGLRLDMANSSFNRRRNDVNAEQPNQAIGGADRPPFHDRQLPPPLFHPPLPTRANGGIPTTPPSNATRFNYPREYIRPREEVGDRYHTGPHNPYAVSNQVQRSGLQIRRQELAEWSAALNHREQAVAAREAQMAWLERQRDSSSQSSRVGRVGQLIDEAQTTPTPQGWKRKRATSNEMHDDYDRVDFGAAPPAPPILRPCSIMQAAVSPLMRKRVPYGNPRPSNARKSTAATTMAATLPKTRCQSGRRRRSRGPVPARKSA